MKTIYIDSDFKCHASNSGDLTAVDTSFFDGKCLTFIEGYRFVPSGDIWMREDDATFAGEMAAPWKPYAELDAAQREYEKQLLSEYAEALRTVGVSL